MVRVKARDLRGKKKEDLTKQLDEQKTELASLQVVSFVFCPLCSCRCVYENTLSTTAKFTLTVTNVK
ncbi:unnamed protein product [Anisakis simplex]|uniref:60S ribosomal protein L35 n=1 Tax=Anisakis simplex TaxID=6269 RepID=A0A0M3JCJ0_ANISI|nr:unnamed protein product [Anisakis simplex]